jgi:hypothetical protein
VAISLVLSGTLMQAGNITAKVTVLAYCIKKKNLKVNEQNVVGLAG